LPALAQAPVDDLTLARRVLESPALLQVGRATGATVRAATEVGTALPTPRVVLRQEGPGDGSATTAAGLELDLDLSGRTDLARRAGGITGEVAGLEARVVRSEAVCEVRQQALLAQAADASVAVREAAHQELEALAGEVDRLVAGKEKAAFDAERVALKVSLHAQALQAERAQAVAARGALAGRLGAVDGPLAVEPAEPTPAWIEEAIQRSPSLVALRKRSAGAGARRAVGERWWVPGIGIYGAWRRDAQDDDAVHGYEAGLTVELPLVDRGAPVRAEADADQARWESEAALAEAALRARVAALLQEMRFLDTSAEKINVSEGFADRARKRYRSGIAPLADLFEALEALEAGALARQAVDTRRRQLRLELACALGVFPEKVLEELMEGASR
jgi:outer membrane protein TolC